MKKYANNVFMALALAGLLAVGSCKDKNADETTTETTTTTTTNDMDEGVRESPIDTIAEDNDTVISTEGVNTPNANPVGEQEP